MFGKKRSEGSEWWQFLMLVEGFDIPGEEGHALVGAYTTRTVNSGSEAEALIRAKESITAELSAFDRSVDPNLLRFTCVQSRSLHHRANRKSPNKGFAFFLRGDNEWKAVALEIETAAHKWNE